MDRKPAANIDPIKDTPSLNTASYLGKRLRQSESEIPVDMRPIHQLSSISRNPFITETLTESPVVTELNVIGKEDLGLLKEEPIPKVLLKGARV